MGGRVYIHRWRDTTPIRLVVVHDRPLEQHLYIISTSYIHITYIYNRTEGKIDRKVKERGSFVVPTYVIQCVTLDVYKIQNMAICNTPNPANTSFKRYSLRMLMHGVLFIASRNITKIILYNVTKSILFKTYRIAWYSTV